MSLYKRPGSDKYWIRLHIPGQRRPKCFTTGTADKQEAQRIHDRHAGEVANGMPLMPRADTVQFWELAEGVLLNYENKGYKSIKTAECRLRLHVVPFFGAMKAAFITPNEIAVYQKKRRQQGAKPATISHELELVKSAYTLGNLAYQNRLPVPHIELPKVQNAKSGFFELVDFEKVMEAIDPQYRPFLLFAYITGWRSGEIKNLRRRHVDFVNHCVRLDPGTTKNGDARVFPFTDQLEFLLRSVVPPHGFADDYVFTYTARNKKGEPIRTKARYKDADGQWQLRTLPATRPVGDFGTAFATACYKAGLPCKTETWSYVEPKSGKQFSGVRVLKGSHTPHDFRRTAVRNLTSRGVPEKVAMQMCGHNTREVFDRYRIVAQTDLDIAAAKLNAVQDGLERLLTAAPAHTVAHTVSRFGKAK